MNDQPFQTFINLVKLDQSIRESQEDINKIKKEIADFEEQQQSLEAEHEKFHDLVKQNKKIVDTLELEMKALDEKQKVKLEQLDQVKDNKQYQPLKREIETIKGDQAAKEEEVIEAWNKLETSLKEFKEFEKEYESKLSELQQLKQQKLAAIEDLKTSIAERNKIRPEKERGIPAEWLEKYTHMRLQVPDPVVPLLQESCSACFYSVLGQDLTKIKRKSLVQCRGCFRLLYSEDAMQG